MVQLPVIEPHEWNYHDEGGAHMIFTYSGQNNNLRQFCLRLCKYIECSSAEPPWEKIREYIPSKKTIFLEFNIWKSLISRANLKRPNNRTEKPLIFIAKASLIKNLHSPGSLSFELKPKWHGLLSIFPPKDLPTSESHHLFCRFCSKGTYMDRKTPQGSYCPEALFNSNSLDEIIKVLDTVLESKYCKVFFNGLLVKDKCSEAESKKIFIQKLNITSHVGDFLLRSHILSLLSDHLTQSFQNLLQDSYSEEDILWFYSLQDISLIINMQSDLSSLFSDPVLHIIDLDMKPREKLPLYSTELSIIRSKMKNKNYSVI